MIKVPENAQVDANKITGQRSSSLFTTSFSQTSICSKAQSSKMVKITNVALPKSQSRRPAAFMQATAPFDCETSPKSKLKFKSREFFDTTSLERQVYKKPSASIAKS